MTTIGHFEQALGRVALWSSHRDEGDDRRAVRPAAAHLSARAARPQRLLQPGQEGAAVRLLSGQHQGRERTRPARSSSPACRTTSSRTRRRTRCSTACIPRFNEPVNHDVLAFHEAFADIVALFQHFSYPGVLRDQIARTRGNLAGENLLGQLAQQFGTASGRGNALRDALGAVDPATGKWEPRTSRTCTRSTRRTSRTIAARSWSRRCSVRSSRSTRRAPPISTASPREGTGVLREGDIHPDLAEPPRRRGGALRDLRAADVHPRDRLLPAGRHHLRRLSARDRHRRLRPQPGRLRAAIGWRSSRASASGASARRACAACRSKACCGRPATRRWRKPASPSTTRR